jgi:hypothetical protein
MVTTPTQYDRYTVVQTGWATWSVLDSKFLRYVDSFAARDAADDECRKRNEADKAQSQ